MKRHAPRKCVYHFGPSTDYVGGMASVIAMLVTQKIGAERVKPVDKLVLGLLNDTWGLVMLALKPRQMRMLLNPGASSPLTM